ncbi:MAG: FlgO family outer membrane protein [Alishewanella sp.]|nr:FlgO family outer membrane protein [Alishewanella sp.]
MKYLLASAILLLLCGCAQKAEPEPTVKMPLRQVSAVGLSARPLDFYTHRLAQTLFASISSEHFRSPLAVSSFLPTRQLSLAQLSEQEIDLANQLAESMLSEAVQRGFVAVDLRLRQELLLQTDHEQALSRQISALRQQHGARALLTGTYTVQEDGLVVNVRLIELDNQQVIAAATDFVPHNVMWSPDKIHNRGNYLFSSDRIGEKP